MGSIKDRNGMELTEAEDVKKRRKNTQKNCTIEIFTTKEAGIYSGAKTASSINGAGKTGQLHIKE